MKSIKTAWLAAAAVSIIAYVGLAVTDQLYGTLRAAQTPSTIGWFLLAFAGFAVIVFLNEKGGSILSWIWAVAIVARAVLLFTTPTLSDDVYRYLWDGHVAAQGVSPYALAIEDPALDYLDVPARALANNPWMASPYLPAAQLIFWASAALLPLRPFYLQLAMVIVDLAAGWLIIRLLALASLPRRRVALYLLNPLVILEVAHGAHIDAWMIFLTLAAVLATLYQPAFNPGKDRLALAIYPYLAPLLLALATLTKILPVLLLPVLFWRWSWRQRFAYGLLTILLLIPFGVTAGWGLSGELDGTGLFGALRIYGDQWNFNSGLFHWLEALFFQNGIATGTAATKRIVGTAQLTLLIIVWLTSRSIFTPRATLRALAVPLMGYVLLTPTVHPWYLLFLLSFVPFLSPSDRESNLRWWTAAPWLYLSGALIFSYLTYLDPQNFAELSWVRWLEWGPTLTLLLVSLFFYRESRLSDWFQLRLDSL